MTPLIPLCPKCQGEEWDGTTCGICKYDVRIPWTIDDDGIGVESSYTYRTHGEQYGIRIELNKFSYPHSTATLDVAEALKLAALIITSCTEAIRQNEEAAEADRRAEEYRKTE